MSITRRIMVMKSGTVTVPMSTSKMGDCTRWGDCTVSRRKWCIKYPPCLGGAKNDGRFLKSDRTWPDGVWNKLQLLWSKTSLRPSSAHQNDWSRYYTVFRTPKRLKSLLHRFPHTKTTEVVTTPFSAWTPRKEAQGPPTLKAPRSPAQMGKLFFRSFLV